MKADIHPKYGAMKATCSCGNVIQTQFARDALPTAAALSFSLMAVILVVVFTYIRRAGTEELL